MLSESLEKPVSFLTVFSHFKFPFNMKTVDECLNQLLSVTELCIICIVTVLFSILAV